MASMTHDETLHKICFRGFGFGVKGTVKKCAVSSDSVKFYKSSLSSIVEVLAKMEYCNLNLLSEQFWVSGVRQAILSKIYMDNLVS